uniref:Sushi domain-containing protein n=1 Tax=Anabas testudineus TaxID=64144 RepID=A0A3Q1IR84_ANATE
MDLGSLYVSVSVIMACLLGAARTSPNDNNKCCPKIAGRDLTKDPPEDCFKVDGRFRYACKEGFVRKAGTSDLIKCSESNGSLRWTSASLQCIPDPKRTKPQPPQSTVTTGYSHIPPDVTTTGISSTIIPEEVTKVLTTAKTEHTASASTTSNSSNAWRHGTSDYGQQDGPSTSQADQMVAVAITCVSLAIICTLVGFYCYRRRRNMEEEEAAERPEERVPMNGLP